MTRLDPATWQLRPADTVHAGHVIRWFGNDYRVTRLVEVLASGTIVFDLAPTDPVEVRALATQELVREIPGPCTALVGRQAPIHVRIDSITDPLTLETP